MPAMRWLGGAVAEWDVPGPPHPEAPEAPEPPGGPPPGDLTLDAAVRLESPTGRVVRLPAFAGSAGWRARAWIDEPGTWRWTVGGAGGAGGAGAPDGRGALADGTFEAPPGAGAGPAAGPLRVSATGRYLELPNGAPFFYLGDTAWFVAFKGSPPDWERYLDRRAAQGFNVIQIQLLPFDWEAPDPDGNRPFAGDDLGRPNDAYFARIDGFCALAAARGLYVLLALMWGGNRPGLPAARFSTAQAVAFARYAVARYAAFPVLWSLSGDAPYVEEADKWDAVGGAVEAADPHRHPTTNHLPPSMNWRFLHHGAPWHDFHMLQTGHRRAATPDVAALPAAYFRHSAPKPVLNGEPWYEGHPEMDGWHARARGPGEPPPYGAPFTALDARYAFWTSVLGGATMGHGYGAQGLWNWKRRGDSEAHLGGPQIGPTWEEALELAGGSACAVGAATLRTLPWWKLEPCPERVAVDPPHALHRPACARAPGEAWVAYLSLPEGGERVTLKGLEEGGWHAVWIDPQTGERHPVGHPAGDARPGPDGLWRPGPPPSRGDWVLVLQR